MELKFRNNRLAIKDIDLSKRKVEGYFAAFGNVDSDGDMIMPGAFKKTIKENRERIAHLLQHDTWSPIGKLMELEEDSIGLRFVSQLSQSTKGNDTLIQYQEGILKEHSIGFNTIQEKRVEDSNGNYKYNEIQEVKLWEGSTVTFGANPLTPVVGIKSDEERKNEAIERINQIESYLKKGKVTDDAFRLLEFEMQVLKNILSLEIKEPPTHSKDNEPTLEVNLVETFKSL